MSVDSDQIAAIAKVAIDGQPAGTAFLVAAGLAITARHVVAGRAGALTLAFEGNGSVPATVVHPTSNPSPKDPDWALLSCTAPPGVKPLALQRLDRIWGQDRWFSYGFGLVFIGQDRNKKPGPLNGIIQTSQPLSLGCGALEGQPATDAQGFSGAPVLSSGCVIGIIGKTRGDEAGAIKAGFIGAVSTSEILADWPAAIPAPDLERGPLVRALENQLSTLTNLERDTLASTLSVVPESAAVYDRRLAEGLIAAGWRAAREALLAVVGARFSGALRKLVDALWLHADAASELFDVMNGTAPIAVIRTPYMDTVRHHLVRAQTVDRRCILVNWDTPPRIVPIVLDSGESLDAVVEKTLTNLYQCEAEEIVDHMSDFERRPTILVLNSLVDDDDLASLKKWYEAQRLAAAVADSKLVIIAFDAAASDDQLQKRPMKDAKLITPFPDKALEKASQRTKEKV